MRCEGREKNGGKERDTQEILKGWIQKVERAINKLSQKYKERKSGIPGRNLEKEEPFPMMKDEHRVMYTAHTCSLLIKLILKKC